MRVEIHESARKHGVLDADIHHAYDHTLAWLEIGEDPNRYLVAGPSRAGNLLELVVLMTHTVELVIHGMRLRPVNEAKLFRGEER